MLRLISNHSPDITYLSANEIPEGLPKDVDGKPIHYRWMTVAQVGKYIHPQTKKPIIIDKPRLDRWDNDLRATVSRKVEVPICADHKYANAKATMGYVHGSRIVEVDGKPKLQNLLGFVGDENLDTARANKLSVGVDDWEDAHGVKHEDAIFHVAVTSRPVLHGSTGFLASSDGGEQSDDYILSVAEEPDMPFKLTSKQRTHVATLLSVDAAAIPEEIDGSTVTQIIDRAVELSVNPPTNEPEVPEIRPKLVKANYRDYESQVNVMTREGKISRASGQLLLGLIQKDGKPNEVLLSVEDHENTAVISFDKLLELVPKLREGKPTDEKTGPQGSTLLSRDLPKDEPDDLEKTADQRLTTMGDAQSKKFVNDRLRAQGHKVE